MEENLVWKLISYFFLFYESYEIKFPTKISSFTAYRKVMYKRLTFFELKLRISHSS